MNPKLVKDEKAILNNIKTMLSIFEKPKNSDTDYSQPLIDFLAQIGDLLSLFQDKILEEAYLETTRKREIISRAARLLEYFTAYETHTAFVAYSNGEPNQSFSLGEEPEAIWVREVFDIEEESINIIDEKVECVAHEGWRKWISASDFSGLKPDDRYYRIDTAADGSTRIIFGDGIRGKRLPTGSSIQATYRTGSGKNRDVNLCLNDIKYLESILGIPSTRYGDVLSARRLVNLQGVGSPYSGDYYIENVKHSMTSIEYKTKFMLTLRPN